jgi:hypothetical protein
MQLTHVGPVWPDFAESFRRRKAGPKPGERAATDPDAPRSDDPRSRRKLPDPDAAQDQPSQEAPPAEPRAGETDPHAASAPAPVTPLPPHEIDADLMALIEAAARGSD